MKPASRMRRFANLLVDTSVILVLAALTKGTGWHDAVSGTRVIEV